MTNSSLDFLDIEISNIFQENANVITSQNSNRKIAVFDADGTLWDRDMGEAFFRWLIAGKKLQNVDYSTDIYADYEQRVEQNRLLGYQHAIEIMAGIKLDDLAAWSYQFAASWPNYRNEVKMVIHWLKEQGFEIWIVTASNEWTIKQAAPFVGIEPEKVIGIKSEIIEGVISKDIIKPVTCNAGKVEAIEKIIGQKPVFAFGDSMGDFEMLNFCHQPLVIGEKRHIGSSILEQASSNKWPVWFF